MSHIENIHKMLETLTDCANSQLSKGIDDIDTKEFGEVTDMVKDLCEAAYYCSVKEAMEEYGDDGEEDGRRYYDRYRYKNGRFAPKGRGTRRGYDEMMHMTPEMYREHEYEPEYYRDMDRKMGRMYYTDSGMTSGNSSGGNSGNMGGSSQSRNYGGDGRSNNGGNHNNESRYDRARRNYTESKQMHKGNTADDKQANMKSLEDMLKVFGEDFMDFVGDMSQEEKNLAKQKLSTTVAKIV